MSSKLQSFLSKVDEAESLFASHSISAAVKLLQTASIELHSLEISERQIAEARMNEDQIVYIRSRGQELNSLLQLLQESVTWKLWSDSHGIILSSMEIVASPGQFYFKTEKVIEIEQLYIVAALMEVDLYPTWMSRCVHAEVLKSISPYQRLVFSVMDYFFFKREALLIGYGDALLDGGLFLFVKSAAEDNTDFDITTIPTSKNPRVELEGGFLIKEELVGSTQDAVGVRTACRTSICFRVDPKIDYLPHWLFNYLMKVAIWHLLPMLESQAKLFRPGQALHHKIAENQSLYDDVLMRIKATKAGGNCVSSSPENPPVDAKSSSPW